ncbi:MAG: hypothetical protein ABEJ98_02910 [Candidatus Nanohaloarchaea archaeon]
MGEVSEEEIKEIHAVMAGEHDVESEIETEEEAYSSAIDRVQEQEMARRRSSYSDAEWDALVPVLKGQKHFNTGRNSSKLSQLYSGVLDTLEDPGSFSRKLQDFSRSHIIAIGETPKGDELVLSDSRSNIRTTGGLHYLSRTARNVSVEVKKDSLEEIDYRSEEIDCSRLRNAVVETQKRISEGFKELESRGYTTPAPEEVSEKKIRTDFSLKGFEAR